MAKSDNPAGSAADSFLFSVEMAAQNTSPEQEDPFWTHEEIDAARWNQIFPYQLILVKQDKDGKYIQEQSSDADQAKNWVYTLPFPPEAINNGMPFAIAGNVTQGGYAEEHGGAPIRNISFSGSLGVLPLRPSAATRREDNMAQAIFAGTIEQTTRVADSAQNLAGNFQGSDSAFTPNLVEDSTFQDADADRTNVAKTSGYYQLRLMQEFFENYVKFKMTEKGQPYRLALCIWKHQAVYLVTPTAFNSSFNANSPLEPTYQLNFRAWRRITFDSIRDKAANQFVPAVRQPNKMAAMLKSLQDARDVLENSRDVISAVGGDLDKALFEPLRQTGMFLRDALNVPLSFADLPVQILNESQTAVVQYISLKQAGEGAAETFSGKSQKVIDAYRNLAKLGATTSKLETASANLVGALDSTTDSAYDVFRHPEDNYNLFKDLKPSQVHLPPKSIRAIQNERIKIRLLKRIDFENMRDTVQQLQADFADAVGAGNATYNKTYHRAVRAVSKTPTASDYKVMFALNRVIMEMNRLAASGATNRQRLSTIDFLAGLARRSGLAFITPRSKFAVPMPYGITLEQLAYRYLGNPDRWIEIVALNGLRAPYVDEVGFDLPLLTNGSGNEISVADASNLAVNQQIWISSTTTSRTTRRITKLRQLSVSTTIVTVDGDPDLDRFSTLASASIHAFLPDTVNSMMMLYIPSANNPAADDSQTKAIPGLDEFDNLLNVGGVDLLLTSSNDLAITPDGDCRLAVGLTNIVQTARIRLSVIQGTLHRHPNFGLPIKPGQSTADVDASTLLKAAKNLFVDDPTFTGVRSASVRKAGPVTSIGISIGVRGQSQDIPVTIDIKR